MVYYNDFKGEKLSSLGFGTMRLPLLEGGKAADVNQEEVNSMVDYAIEHGVNYFDSAYMYHDGYAEVAIGKALARHPRDKWLIADKYPGYQYVEGYDVEGVFAKQLKRCQVDCFDFYLFHNVNDSSIRTYLNPDYRMIDRVLKIKEDGKIRHLGFYCHGSFDCVRRFVEEVGEENLEFCQIQLNYLDWTLQDGKKKYEYLTEHGIPIWVMEPCRGGKLAQMDEINTSKLKALRGDESTAAWAFRFLQGLPNVKVVLSGMSNMDQAEDNCRTFSERKALDVNELETILNIAEGFKTSVPCTECRYCCEGCPMEIDIPKLISIYNDYKFYPSVNINILLSAFDKEHMPGACIGCGQCASVCPQRIDIPGLMKEMDGCFSKLKTWEEICKEREAADKARNY